MRSRGYINDTDWEFAHRPDLDYPGGINLTFLGIDGLLPDSGFKLKNFTII